jgi:hypothetical protein
VDVRFLAIGGTPDNATLGDTCREALLGCVKGLERGVHSVAIWQLTPAGPASTWSAAQASSNLHPPARVVHRVTVRATGTGDWYLLDPRGFPCTP